MAHKRSGAQRRAAQKARRFEDQRSTRQPHLQQRADTSSSHPAQALASRGNKAPLSKCHPQESRGSKAPLLKPQLQEVLAAVRSLYDDEMKPFARLLRKRLVECSAPNACTSSKPPDVDICHLLAVCEWCDELVVTPEDGGEWSAILANTPSNFVELYSLDDVYPAEFWAAMSAYIASAPEEEMTFPGGRYACAYALQSRRLPFFAGRSLGQLSHIVQLAISDKKLLGYLNGAVVPYGCSQSMRKERSAGRCQALANPCVEAAALPCATLQEAKACLRTILAEARSNQRQGPGQIALSNVKRMFRTQFELELSETTLGHSKLTELLQDNRFSDTCYVQLGRTGYTVVEHQQPSHDLWTACFCSDEPLCISDAEQASETITFGPTPGPFGATPLRASSVFELAQPLRAEGVDTLCDPPAFCPIPGLFNPAPVPLPTPLVSDPAPHDDANYLKQLLHDYLGQTQSTIQPQSAIQEAETNPRQFCLHEPLCFETAEQESHMPVFGPTPGAFGWSPSPQRQHTRPLAVASQPPLPSMSPWKDGQIDSMVLRTFIHAHSPTKNLVSSGHRRSNSTGDLSESTSARSASCDSNDANRDLVYTPRYRDLTASTDSRESFPPTPMVWVPPTPLAPPGLEYSVPPFQQPCAEFPVLSLSHLLVSSSASTHMNQLQSCR
jgi:hypothetical protein